MSNSSGGEGQCFSMAKAEAAFNNGNYEEALKHFFVCIKMLPAERRGLYEEQFATSMHAWIALTPSNASRAVTLYPQIRDLFPETILTKMAIVKAVISTGQKKWILNCLPIVKDALALATSPRDKAALRIARVNLTTIPFPQWHFRMINDTMRNDAFRQAMNMSIKSRSSVVFDIGSGTGLLSVMAARQTNLVIALEEDLCLAMLSKEVVKRNGMDGRITVHAKNSMQFETNQKADVIVSETLDCCAFGERIIETFLDAHVRFAHENTIFIPHKATVFVRIFKCREIYDIHCQDHGGIRYRSEYVKINNYQTEQPYWCASHEEFADFEFLTEPVEIHTANFSRLDLLQKSLRCSGALKLKPLKKGVAHGFAIHFEADLTNRPDLVDIRLYSECSRAWDLGIIPFKEACLVDVDEELNVSWQLEANRLDVYNNFYSEELEKAGEKLRYQTISMEEIYKIRDISYFNKMMAEIDPNQLPHVMDLSLSIPVRCFLKPYPRKEPISTLIGGFVRHDGALDRDAFMRIEENIHHRDFVKKIVPSKVRIIGYLFYSDTIHFDARPDPLAHFEVDLSQVRSFNLREMRDIRLSQRKDIVKTSDDFEIFELNNTPENFKSDWFEYASKEITVHPNSRMVDGVIYEFEFLGLRNTKVRPVAAFLFQERIYPDDEIKLQFDMCLGEMFVSLKEKEEQL